MEKETWSSVIRDKNILLVKKETKRCLGGETRLEKVKEKMEKPGEHPTIKKKNEKQQNVYENHI